MNALPRRLVAAPLSLALAAAVLAALSSPARPSAAPANDPDAREWLAMAYSPVTHVRADSPPMLIMHGDSDKMSPLDQAVRLHDAARAAGAWSRLVVVPGAEHVFLGADIEAQWQVAIDFLGDTIGPRA